MDETALIHNLKQGNQTAFRQLVETYQNRVYNTVLSMLQAENEAEDVCQEVFIEVFESIGKFKGESKLFTWIYRIAISKTLDTIRKKKRKKRGGLLQSLFSRKSSSAFEQPDFIHPGIQLEDRERAAILFKAIDKLPDNQKIAFTLSKIESLSYQEISEAMNISVSSVESLLFRAKKILQKYLYDYYKNEAI